MVSWQAVYFWECSDPIQEVGSMCQQAKAGERARHRDYCFFRRRFFCSPICHRRIRACWFSALHFYWAWYGGRKKPGYDPECVEADNFCDLHKKALTDHLDLINSKNSDQLKSFYKETRSKPRIVGQKGAGLGLIFIARKSKNPIEYEIIEEGQRKFLIISVKIGKENRIY